MSRSLAAFKANLPVARQEKIQARAKELMAQMDGLKPLRTALDKTQAELAERLHISQASVARIEKRTDLLLSTLRHYVEGLGGELNLVAKMPGQPEIRISGLGDIQIAVRDTRHGKKHSRARISETVSA